jgi:hypothetical protein
MIITVLAGIWNIIAGVGRLGLGKRIKARDASIPAEFESLTGLVLIGIVNFLVGGVIGLAFVAFDFFVREKVLTNSHLFGGPAARVNFAS